MTLTKAQHKEAKALCEELPRIKDRLFRAGLTSTAAAMDLAVKRIGYELAEKVTL